MTQYKERIERQKLLLEAEAWANGVKSIHSFDSNRSRLWYDDREPEGKVFDIMYNDQRIERTLKSGEIVLLSGEQLDGDELISAYQDAKNNGRKIRT